ADARAVAARLRFAGDARRADRGDACAGAHLMISRLIGLIAVAWGLGFAAFTLLLAQPSDVARTDAIVVPTGGAGRIARGLALIEEKRATRMLVTGVAPGVSKSDLADVFGHAAAIDCCVDLGRQ